ncbi:MAG: LysE family transporter [Gammaproteobacteria bacterium]|jgi:threonine/homoserine/homoserine lactone efflux protein|nr:LysE family transporter [Gammaproteobacteria bacterium]
MFFEKILLGITLAAPIGPVSLEMIKRGLNIGFLGAFVVRLGGSVGNSLCLVAAYFGLGLFMNSDLRMGICSIIGAFVLMYLGFKSLLDKRKHELKVDKNVAAGVMNGLLTGFILSITSPIGIVFWLSIFAATLDLTVKTQSWVGLSENFTIILGVLIWGLFLSGLLELGKRFFNHKLINLITTIAGLMLIGFGIKYAYKGIVLLG